jgi:hypothetical protein
MKKFLALVLVMSLTPGVVLAQMGDSSWFGKTKVNAGNLDIAVQSYRTVVPMVRLENRSDKFALCTATFSNGPQFAETRFATIPPGKNATLGRGIPYITAKVDIDVNCAERTG